MKKILLSLFLLSLISTTACNNDDDNGSNDPIDQLPDATQTGENTFGFLLNGEPINVTNTNEQVAIYQGGVLQLGGGIDNSEMDINVIINVSETLNINESYDLTNITTNLAIFVDNGNNCYYDYPNTYQGSLFLTNFDQTNYIISGTFEFSTVTDDCESINITNGRFDLHYIP